MVVRGAELERLAGLAPDAAGRGRLIPIEGEPGSGKTALLRSVLADGRQHFRRRT